MFPQEFPFRKCQLQDEVTQLEVEAAPRVQEAQPKEQGKAEAASLLQGVLLRWQEPKQGLQRLLQQLMLHTGTMCLKVRRPEQKHLVEWFISSTRQYTDKGKEARLPVVAGPKGEEPRTC